ncbi:unnamed protein product [Rotaria magnacalcarata]|uniref:Uncharacterized protein n=4 Tax=Rotaria magnacalcarata TaxID=392030 RepID=A0A816LTE8_9BILA|nr:unnamed protein product [Rotaria magnacalcarata]
MTAKKLFQTKKSKSTKIYCIDCSINILKANVHAIIFSDPFSFQFGCQQHRYKEIMQNLIAFIIVVILTIHIQFLVGLPLMNDDETYSDQNSKRSDEPLLPNGNFSLVTKEKLLKLQELADAVHDPKLHDLYRAVNHYVQMAKKNNEYVLWKYDANQEGLVLVLKQNLNGILYYG